MAQKKVRKTKRKGKEESSKNLPIKDDSKKYEKQTKIAILAMIVLIVSIFAANWIVQASKKFDYNGINFYIEKEGMITYYKSNMFASIQGQQIPFILKLRNDPRKLDVIPFDGNVSHNLLGKQVILSVDPALANCSNTYITLIDFAATLKGFGIAAEKATTDKEYAEKNKILKATCKESLQGTPVIMMEEGNQTEIYRNVIFTKCYVMRINNCEIQESFERFLLGFIEGSSIKTR